MEHNLEKSTKQDALYAAKPKLFGEKAERIQKSEYDLVISELLGDLEGHFHEIRGAGQLKDKESFGDIDFVYHSNQTIDELYFRKIFSDRLMDYRHNGHVHSALIKLDSGRQIHVDFIQSKDEIDFERKFMFYSKGHTSSIVGMLARKLNFKYGTEGFFKRFQDKRGNWHDILISEDLRDGLLAMGLDPMTYDNIHIVNDIIDFIAKSPFFDSSYFGSESMIRSDRESIRRNKSEDYIVQKLKDENRGRSVADENEFLKKLFPDRFRRFEEESERINRETYKAGAINGGMVMGVFAIKPGPSVGKILKFIGDNYPDAKDLSEEMVDTIKTKFF